MQKIRFIKFFSQIVLALFFINSASAADLYKFDPNHTSVTWTSNHFGFSSPSGKFTDVDGTITIDEQNPQNSSVDVTVKVASLATGLQKFDNTIRGQDFLDTAKFPTARFVSNSVTPTGSNTARVSGNLTLHGVTNLVNMDVRLNKIGTALITQRKTAGFTASFTIKRSLFGMSFGLPGIADDVKINIEVEAFFTAPETGSTPQQTSSRPWKIIPDKSKLEFSANQDTSKIFGSFKKFGGKINFAPSHLETSEISIAVDTTSVEVSFSEANDVLQGAAWLATQSFPTALFKSERFVPLSGKLEFRMFGNLTLKGVTVPISIDFYLKEFNENSAHAIGKSGIKRSDFNIGNRDPKQANGVDDNIALTFEIFAEK